MTDTSTAASCPHPAGGATDANHEVSGTDDYVTWKNPWVYFHSILDGTQCSPGDVGLTKLAADLKSERTTPAISYIAPDPCDDGSDTPCRTGAKAGLAQADAFLKTVVPEIEASPAYRDNGLIVITFDQAPQSGPDWSTASCCDQPTFPNLTGTSTTGTTSTGTSSTGTSSTPATGTTTTSDTTPATTTASTTPITLPGIPTVTVTTTETAPSTSTDPVTTTAAGTTPATGTGVTSSTAAATTDTTGSTTDTTACTTTTATTPATDTTATTPTTSTDAGTTPATTTPTTVTVTTTVTVPATTATTTTTPSSPSTGASTDPTASTPTTPGCAPATVGDPPGGGQVGLLLISPYVQPGSTDVIDVYNHFSLLASEEKLFDLPTLGYAGDAALPTFNTSLFLADKR